jgi:hypothetical protein
VQGRLAYKETAKMTVRKIGATPWGRQPHGKKLDKLFNALLGLGRKDSTGVLREVAEELAEDVDCDKVYWTDHDEDGPSGGSLNPDIPMEEIFERHESGWLGIFRKSDRKFDKIVTQFVDLHEEDEDEALEWLEEEFTEVLFGRVLEDFDGEQLDDTYEHVRDNCQDGADYAKDPYAYYGMSRSDFYASRLAARTMTWHRDVEPALEAAGHNTANDRSWAPWAKDMDRAENIAERAYGDPAKMLRLSENMAKSIKNLQKAVRRGRAVEEHIGSEYATPFYQKALELLGRLASRTASGATTLHPLFDSVQPFVKNYGRFLKALVEGMESFSEMYPWKWDPRYAPDVLTTDSVEVEGESEPYYVDNSGIPAGYDGPTYTIEYPSKAKFDFITTIPLGRWPAQTLKALKSHVVDAKGFLRALKDLTSNSSAMKALGGLYAELASDDLYNDGAYHALIEEDEQAFNEWFTEDSDAVGWGGDVNLEVVKSRASAKASGAGIHIEAETVISMDPDGEPDLGESDFDEGDYDDGHYASLKVATRWMRAKDHDIPKEVEEKAKEVEKGNPGYDDAKVWATAWSIYCKHIEPGSDHCSKKPGEYLKKKATELEDFSKAGRDAGAKKKVSPHMYVISKIQKDRYMITLGDPRSSRAKIIRQGEAWDMKDWYGDQRGRISDDHIIDVSGLKLVSDKHSDFYESLAKAAGADRELLKDWAAHVQKNRRRWEGRKYDADDWYDEALEFAGSSWKFHNLDPWDDVPQREVERYAEDNAPDMLTHVNAPSSASARSAARVAKRHLA